MYRWSRGPQLSSSKVHAIFGMCNLRSHEQSDGCMQEARALRFLSSTGFVQLQGLFMQEGHLCLVLERLLPSLLHRIATAAQLLPAQHMEMLRRTAYQLLVKL